MPPLDEVASALPGVGALVAIATIALLAFRVPGAWAPATALARGALQLAAISFLLTGIVSDPQWVLLALGLMLLIATGVTTHRIGWSIRTALRIGAAIAAGVTTTILTVFGTGALELSARNVLAASAITLGGSMSIATLTGRTFTRAARDHWHEIEGWLALGARPRQASIQLARMSVRDSLIPAIDQTKTTGLVVLPGAFIGAIFAGLSPLEAGRFQIVVLASILAAGAITATLTAAALADTARKPAAP